MATTIPSYAQDCQQLRWACEHKEELGLEGAGTCRRYREQCSVRAAAPPRAPPSACCSADNGAKDVREPILETGYSLLSKLGNEDKGYGLYSYVIATSASDRSSAFLKEVLGSVTSVANTAAPRAQINVLYIPLKMDQRQSFSRAAMSDAADTGKLASEFASTLYDYKLARALLDHLCSQPVLEMKDFCVGRTGAGRSYSPTVNLRALWHQSPPPSCSSI